MNVYLKPNGQEQIPGDLILSWVLRSDLAPVPRTLEMTFQDRDGMHERLGEGARLWTGRELLEYRVVKIKKAKPVAVVQGKDQLSVYSVTALLASCAEVAFRRPRAVIMENSRIGALYRACGASAAISEDIPITRFSCFAGQVPSFHLAKVMQESAAVLVFRDGRLAIARIADLFRQEPKDVIGQTDSTDLIESEFLQRHEIPAFYSVAEDGSFVRGDFSLPRAIHYLPRSDELVLRNATRVLVTKRVIDSQMAQAIQAGDVIEVAGEKMVVITAAHSSQLNDGRTETASRFWTGVLSQ